MSFFDENFIVQEGPFNSAEITNIVKEPTAIEKAEIKKLEEETLLMDQRNVAMRIRELRDADHKGNQEKINALIKDFKEIDKCLGNDSKIFLELKKDECELLKKENSSNLYNNAKLKNVEAKLGIIKYKSIIKEAAGRPMRNDMNNREIYNSKRNDEGRKLSKKVLAGSAIGIAAIIAMGTGISSCNKKQSFVRENGTTTTITDGTTTTIEATSTMEVTTSTGDYTVETVEGYSAPTRETTTEDTNTTATDKNGNKVTNETTKSTKRIVSTKKLRETTPKNKKTVISKATGHSDKANNQTSQIPTNKNGERTDGKKIETKPTGNKGTLPIKPSKKTLSPEEKQAETVNKSERKVKTLSLSLWK